MKYRVLLIDDEPSALEGMLLWIDWHELGFEVCGTSSNGQEGLQLIKLLGPDLVITDVNMPLMNGLEMVAAWQQEETKKIKFAILSGYSDFEYAKTAIHYGINHYLMKPVFPEEAAEELKEIYEELEQEARKRSLNQRASNEEIVSLIKGLLNEKDKTEAEAEVKIPSTILSKLADGRSHWNFCLVQTESTLNEKIRERAASIIAGKDSMFLIDFEVNLFGIVYAFADSSRDKEIVREITSLQEGLLNSSIYIALGASETSLLQIANSYRTAKEALMHYFYEDPGVLSYQNIQNTPFSYHYDHIQLMDDLIRPVNTLDIVSFKQAVDSASRSFREMRIAPEVVKKVVIHIMHKILEFSTEASEVQKSSLLTQIKIPEMRDSMITLNELISNLLSCGETMIELLLKEQNDRSQGIVHDINHYIEEHYRESLTIKKLSEVFYMHPVYLGQLLMKKNGINFNEQLHTLRIKEAARLLHENKLKNSEIAEEVGYSNYGQFLKQFEKKMKMSPNEYKHNKP